MPSELFESLDESTRLLAARMTPRRVDRMVAVLAGRLGSVTVVAEAVRRRHNVSAILRSAEAFGVHRVHLVTNDFTPSPGAARGTERWVETCVHPSTTACLEQLREDGFGIFVCDLEADAYAPDTMPIEGPCALVFGSELQGVSSQARRLADGVVRVPMCGFAESLNVSVAAALTLSTVCARRRTHVGGGDLGLAEQRAVLTAWIERDTRVSQKLAARHQA